jgi:hypothetical protein
VEEHPKAVFQDMSFVFYHFLPIVAAQFIGQADLYHGQTQEIGRPQGRKTNNYPLRSTKINKGRIFPFVPNFLKL